jgi:predicted pyridoxine 5'-phosphate oxidase superfamily flavin-nucleotide-binding protein
MNWKNSFKKGKELMLATSSADNKPNANIVISLGFVDGKLLVADCLMNNTIRNLAINNSICVIGGHFRAKGTVEIFSKGKYFDICVENNDKYKAKNAILITVNEVFDLNKVESIIIK